MPEALPIAEAVLDKYGLYDSLNSALEFLKADGNILPALKCYRDLMMQRDVGHSDYEASEQNHRDSFYFLLLKNSLLHPQVEFQLTKVALLHIAVAKG